MFHFENSEFYFNDLNKNLQQLQVFEKNLCEAENYISEIK